MLRFSKTVAEWTFSTFCLSFFRGVTLIPIPLPSHHRLRLTVLGLFNVILDFPNRASTRTVESCGIHRGEHQKMCCFLWFSNQQIQVIWNAMNPAYCYRSRKRKRRRKKKPTTPPRSETEGWDGWYPVGISSWIEGIKAWDIMSVSF